MTDRARRSLALAGFLTLTLAVELVAGLATSTSVKTWYPALAKPAWTPPGWVFGPVWAILYILMAVAAWQVWRHRESVDVRLALRLFYLQLAFNFTWSFVFFGLRLPFWGLINILLLLVLILLTTGAFRTIDRRGAVLMLPYALWVAYASTLNAGIWWLNR